MLDILTVGYGTYYEQRRASHSGISSLISRDEYLDCKKESNKGGF
jgi:hypothetical protein